MTNSRPRSISITEPSRPAEKNEHVAATAGRLEEVPETGLKSIPRFLVGKLLKDYDASVGEVSYD